MGFFWKEGKSHLERIFPKKIHISLLSIYFQVWCKIIIIISFFVSIVSIF
jgi:hypothetical protein